jgi:hypothetical protein
MLLRESVQGFGKGCAVRSASARRARRVMMTVTVTVATNPTP